jgi:hypothetical protein
MADSWRSTPLFVDPNSFAFSSFVNQPPGLYTPTRSGTNTLQSEDLHTPGIGMYLGTPLSTPHTGQSLQSHSSRVEMQHFQSHLVNHHPHFHHPFAQQRRQPQQQPYAPSHTLQHHDSGYEAMEHLPHKPSLQQLQDNFMGGAVRTQSISGPAETAIPALLIHGGER